MDKEKALELLSKSPYRMTRTRKAIVAAIFKLKGPFSVNDIVEALTRKAKRPSVDAVTVYRNLPLLEEIGIVCRSDFADDMARFVVSDSEPGRHHHHIVCRRCRKIEALDFCVLDGQEQILNKMGFSEVKHRLEFTGICGPCGRISVQSGS